MPPPLLQIPVETLALAMVADAESKLGSGPEEEPTIFYNKDMRRLANLRDGM